MLWAMALILMNFAFGILDGNAAPKKKSSGSKKKVADKFEPNDSQSKAADITSLLANKTALLSSFVPESDTSWYGAVLSAKIATKKDVDWFKIALDREKIYSVCVNVYNGKTLKGELDNNWSHNLLFGVYADSLLLNDSLTSSMDAPNTENVFQGVDTLYIRVFPNGKTIGDYRLEAKVTTFEKLPPDTFEPNDSIALASQIVFGKKDTSVDINANFNYFTDKDYYKIDFLPKRDYTITINRADSGKNRFVAYYGSEVDTLLGLIPAGELIRASNPDSSESNVFTLEGGGSFYIVCLQDGDKRSIFPYSLHLDVVHTKSKKKKN